MNSIRLRIQASTVFPISMRGKERRWEGERRNRQRIHRGFSGKSYPSIQLLPRVSLFLLRRLGSRQEGRSQSVHSTLPATKSLLGSTVSSDGIRLARGLKERNRVTVEKVIRTGILCTTIRTSCHCIIIVEADGGTTRNSCG